MLKYCLESKENIRYREEIQKEQKASDYMSNKHNSFKEFYFPPREETLNLNDVVDYAEDHEGDIGEFYGNMFCPECQQAKLSFVHKFSKNRAYLRRVSKHETDCSYNYEYAPKKTVKKYIDSLNDKQIQDKLNSIMYMLFRNSKIKKKNIDDSEENTKNRENPMLIPEQNNKKTTLKALRRKSLNDWIDKSDGTYLYVFHGKVKLKVSEKENKSDNPEECYKYYFLDIYTQNKQGEWKFRTSSYRGAIKDSIKEDAIYHIVMIGHLEFKYSPFRINLVNKNAIKYREVK